MLDTSTVLEIDRALHDPTARTVSVLDMCTRNMVDIAIHKNFAGCRNVLINGATMLIVPRDGGDDSEYSRLIRMGKRVTVICTLARSHWGLVVDGEIIRYSPCIFVQEASAGKTEKQEHLPQKKDGLVRQDTLTLFGHDHHVQHATSGHDSDDDSGNSSDGAAPSHSSDSARKPTVRKRNRRRMSEADAMEVDSSAQQQTTPSSSHSPLPKTSPVKLGSTDSTSMLPPRLLRVSVIGTAEAIVSELRDFVRDNNDKYWPFLDEIDKKALPIYYQVIKQPVCVMKMVRKGKRGEYGTVRDLCHDMDLLVSNCRTFNGADSILSKHAEDLRIEFHKIIKRRAK